MQTLILSGIILIIRLANHGCQSYYMNRAQSRIFSI